MPWVLLFDDFAHRRPFQEGSRWVPRFTNSGLLEGLKGRLFWISLQKTMVIRQDIKSFEFGTIEQCQLRLTYSFWILLYTSGRCCERISLRKKWSIFRRELARISLRWNKAFTMRKRWSQSWDSVRLLVCDLYSLQNGRFFLRASPIFLFQEIFRDPIKSFKSRNRIKAVVKYCSDKTRAKTHVRLGVFLVSNFYGSIWPVILQIYSPKLETIIRSGETSMNRWSKNIGWMLKPPVALRKRMKSSSSTAPGPRDLLQASILASRQWSLLILRSVMQSPGARTRELKPQVSGSHGMMFRRNMSLRPVICMILLCHSIIFQRYTHVKHFLFFSCLPKAVESVNDVVTNLLRVQGRMDVLRSKLLEIKTPEATELLECKAKNMIWFCLTSIFNEVPDGNIYPILIHPWHTQGVWRRSTATAVAWAAYMMKLLISNLILATWIIMKRRGLHWTYHVAPV